MEPRLRKNFKVKNSNSIATCDQFLNMLCTELGLDPKIKVVTLVKYYNFTLRCIAIQAIYAIIQLRSNIQLENGSLHYNHDLEAKMVQVMNTKVVPCDIINLFKVLLRSHKHLTHWSHVNPSLGINVRGITSDITR